MLFTNTIGGFINHETSISIPAKSYEVSYLTVTQSDVLILALTTTVLLPLGCMVLGFVIWFRRRKR